MAKTTDELLIEFESIRYELRQQIPDENDFKYYAKLVLYYEHKSLEQNATIRLKIIHEIQDALKRISCVDVSMYSPTKFMAFLDQEAKTPFCMEHVSMLIEGLNDPEVINDEFGRSMFVRVLNYLLWEMARYAHTGGSPINSWLIQYQQKNKLIINPNK